MRKQQEVDLARRSCPELLHLPVVSSFASGQRAASYSLWLSVASALLTSRSAFPTCLSWALRLSRCSGKSNRETRVWSIQRE